LVLRVLLELLVLLVHKAFRDQSVPLALMAHRASRVFKALWVLPALMARLVLLVLKVKLAQLVLKVKLARLALQGLKVKRAMLEQAFLS
jgi:hypothetical protein